MGATWTLPESAARRLSRVSSTLCFQHAPLPDWVTGVRIDAEVRSVKDGVAVLAYAGRIASAHRAGGSTVSAQEVELAGEGVYDPAARRLRSVVLVGTGTLRWPESPGKLLAFDALVEWSLEGGR